MDFGVVRLSISRFALCVVGRLGRGLSDRYLPFHLFMIYVLAQDQTNDGNDLL